MLSPRWWTSQAAGYVSCVDTVTQVMSTGQSWYYTRNTDLV